MRKQALIYMIMAGTLALSGCRATSLNTAANASAVEQNAAQDGQNENNDGNGASDENGAPDGNGGPDPTMPSIQSLLTLLNPARPTLLPERMKMPSW